MDVYKFSFAVLTAANAALGYLQYRTSQQNERSKSISGIQKEGGGNGRVESAERPLSSSDKEAVREFVKNFFVVYIFVVAADWLQGPYLYAIYKDEKSLSEHTTATLFAIGFISAAISASFVGSYADTHGRKRACLAFCIAYSISCASMLFNSLPILLIGRVLGGLSTTLMYSVFETWLVHEFHAQEMAGKGLVLGRVFGWMTTGSSVVAVLAGVVGEVVVSVTGTKVAPFMVAMGCLGAAFVLIGNLWPENYGSKNGSKESNLISSATDIATIIKDTKIASLGIILCLFEGTMYLFVFFWSAALKSAHSSTTSTTSQSPPFGLIFATFMSAMMLGSQLFTLHTSPPTSPTPLTLSSATSSLSTTLLLSATSLLSVVILASPGHRHRTEFTLWAFCLFEACVGMYYPAMGYLKGSIVSDGVRGKVYGLLRLPLNVFVVVCLGVTREGDRWRDGVFLACGGLLIVAWCVCQRGLGS